MRTSSRPVAALLFDEVELLDVAALLSVLSTAGRQWNFRPFKVIPVATTARSIPTRSQLRIEATAALSEHPAPEIVLIPGGYGARRAQGDAEIVDWLGRSGQAATHVLSVGNGTLLAAAAGLIAGHDVATTSELAPALTELCPTARLDTTSPFRDSGKLISAATSGAAAAGALRLVALLLGEKQARLVATSLGLDENLAATESPIIA